MSITVFALVLTAAAMHASWNALVKVNSDRLTLMAVITASQALMSLAALGFVAMPSAAAWPYLAASVVLHNGYCLFLVMAYRYGDLSQVYPVARGTAPLLIALVSVLVIGENLSRQSFAAVAMISLGVMSLALAGGAVRDLRAAGFALATGVFIAAYTVVDGLGARAAGSAHGYVFWLLALDAWPLALFVAWRRRGRVLAEVQRTWKIGLLAGAVSLLAYWIVIWAMTVAPIALVSAVRETSMVFAVLVGVVVLREPLDLARLVSTCMTLGGAVLLKTGR